MIMKLQNFLLRLRLTEIEEQLLQIQGRPDNRLKNERQRRLLNEKTSVQESLDLIIYPILTIPAEITTEIFLHCLPENPAHPSATEAPMLLGAICRVWREIAYSNPRLW
ncbi:hypothetical protein C8R43DRAFT_1174403, partial [Mycena crocata]